ncbi:hypothetical protein AJ79_01737 [Helicocarpus griseus UAMH5409]|uniref:(4-O-methyl)-D-glucuronate--lignin esterase n=1 Tax=Helicocarpus griseus UAMH5409 TaxID=1447875 RepID=A0A2B7Y4I1_9EURO|nr:hypothetical protein AJ79_01737 [Helicocarpus griseus UAMH5409]
MLLNLISASLLAVPALALPHTGLGVSKRQDCPAPGQAAGATELPDPFTNSAGTPITTAAEFTCRQQELFQLFQDSELGEKPGAPESVTASASGNGLTINVSNGGSSISFSVSISYPSGGSEPYPAIIAYGFPSIPVPAGVATITFNNDDIAAQQNTGSRGRGKFYDLYGSDHTASAMTAWAWGVSRIIDALEATPNARINPERIGVTGCSRNGKGAFIAGAFDERVALTLPQESGSGGSACWRLSDEQKRQGQNVQTASQIITENVWFSRAFEQYVNDVTQLPVDHHELAALVAPRGLYVIENTDMEWLGNWSCYGCMVAGHKIYEALGVPDNMGFSQVGGHNHCQFPGAQNEELNAFITKFLLDGDANTAVMRTDGNLQFDEAQWCPWEVPTLA